MFTGFTDKTFEFFMAIRFNNNREFFHENHAWYVESVREPLRELAYELADTIEEIDPDLERRPEKVVSRLNRDLRFTKDKSPYRDYMWLGFDAPREDRHFHPGFYVSVDCEKVSLGMGIYDENRAMMDAHRNILRKNPSAMDEFEPLLNEFTFGGSSFKKMAVPEELNGIARLFYPVRSFWLEKDITDNDLIESSLLADSIKNELLKLKDIYRYFTGIAPLE